jgi:tRNA pseudouridine38-40 synthase
MKLIIDYYKAWEKRDTDELKNFLHEDLYGVRLYTEEKYFTLEEVLNNLPTSTDKIEVKTIDQAEGVVTVDLMINNTPVESKITITDNKIYKLFEAVRTDKRRIKCIISYDGSAYLGYQKQPTGKTIQGTIETSFTKALDEEIIIHSSGRTDKGVHAINQVIHFDTDSKINPNGLLKLLNSYLEDGIYIKMNYLVNRMYPFIGSTA